MITKPEKHQLSLQPRILPVLHKKAAFSILAVLILVIFGGSARFEFINYDDNSYVYENAHISTGISAENLKWALTDTGETNLWHPVTWISHMVDVELFGLENPGGHHAVNVFWHLLTAVGLYLILARLIGNHWLALLLTAIWAIHPQRVQSVAWVSERKDVLSGAFFIWSWLVWEIGRTSRDRARFYYYLSLVLFILAALCKPSVVPLPLILLIREVFRADGAKLQQVIKWGFRLAPFFIVSAAVALLTIYFQRTGGMADITNTMPFSRRLALMPMSLWWYLQHYFWAGDCKLWVYPPKGLLSVWLIPLVGLSVTAAVIFITNRKNHLIKLGCSIYFILWLPVSGIIPVSFYFVADRYSYLPQIGITIMLAGILLTLLEGAHKLRTSKVISVCSIALLLALSLFTWKKTSYWKNSETLFSHERVINKRSLLAPIQLGAIKDDQGKYKEALAYYQEAAAIDKESGLAFTGAGKSLLNLGRKAEAENAFAQANHCKMLRKDTSYSFRAKLMVERNAIQSAERVLKEGLGKFPESITLMMDLGSLALSYQKDPKSALEWYQKTLASDPLNPDAMQGKGVALIEIGKAEEGKQVLRKLIQSHPERTDIKEYLENNP